MNNQPLIFDQIIRGKLNPWIYTNGNVVKFIKIIGDLEQISPGFRPLYEIDFYRYFNLKTKYFYQLITNEANNYCNRIIELISAMTTCRLLNIH